MKHDKKHKRNKSPKRNKKSKKSERKEKKQKHKEKKKSSKNSEKVLKISKEIPTKIVASQSSVKSPITNVEDDYCGPSIGMKIYLYSVINLAIGTHILHEFQYFRPHEPSKMPRNQSRL